MGKYIDAVLVVYDAVRVETFEGGVASLAPRGYLVSYDASGGPVPPVSLSVLNPITVPDTARLELLHRHQGRVGAAAQERCSAGWQARS